VAPCEPLTATVTVTNAGAVAGDEVVQAYLSQPDATVRAPLRTLVGFARVPLAPGQRATVTFTVLPRGRSVMRDGDFARVVEPGALRLSVGGGQPAQRAGAQAPVLAAAAAAAGATTLLDACPGGRALGAWPVEPVVVVHAL